MNVTLLKSGTRGTNLRWHDVELLKIGDDEVVHYNINIGHRVKQLSPITGNDKVVYFSIIFGHKVKQF